MLPSQSLKEILGLLGGMPEDKRKEVIAEAERATKGMVFVPNPGPQTQAYLSKADVLLYGGQAGGGKALYINDLVLTPFGFRTIGDIQVGDIVNNPTGCCAHVIGKYPQGKVQLWRFTFHDGTSVECTKDHLWLAWRSARPTKKNNKLTNGEGGSKVWLASEIIEQFNRNKGKRGNFLFPVSEPVSFNNTCRWPWPIKPYTLGVLLGDGCITENTISVCSADDEIISRLSIEHSEDYNGRTYSGNICKWSVKEKSQIVKGLTSLGLRGCHSFTKFIPKRYLYSSLETRWELLRGLMDTDGWADKDGDIYFCTISPRLRDDVAFLARSLGAVVTIVKKAPTFIYKGQKKKGQQAYSLRIKMRNSSDCFHLSRKKQRCRTPQSMFRMLVDVEKTRIDEAVCIRVDHPNGLFITNDFIVTHNSFMLLGLAAQQHKSSIIFRREASQTDGLERDGKLIVGQSANYNGSDNEWTWPDGRSLKLAGLKEPDDWIKHAGRERDLMGYDEAGEFLEVQVSSLMGWLRGPEGQRCRLVLASNPPRTAEGQWLIKWFAPWLDRVFPSPAVPGELRWCIHKDDKIIWVDGPEKQTIDGKEYSPVSHTFIPASLSDNPYRDTPEYRSKLQALPEPLRSQLLYGDFTAGQEDADNQLIPTNWIIQAQNRWTPRPPQGMAMTVMALDPAGGGQDSAEIAMRYGGWYAPLISAQGEETADGSATAATIVKHRRDNCPVVVDTGGGYGGAVMMRLKDNGIEVLGFNGSELSTAKTNDAAHLAFANRRSEAWWRFREALDPDQEGGSCIALPPDPELRSDLAAPTFQLTNRGLQVESKVKLGEGGKVIGGIKKRLGRSPGKGDAVVMALSRGDQAVMKALHKSSNGLGGHQIILGREAQRRRR